MGNQMLSLISLPWSWAHRALSPHHWSCYLGGRGHSVGASVQRPWPWYRFACSFRKKSGPRSCNGGILQGSPITQELSGLFSSFPSTSGGPPRRGTWMSPWQPCVIGARLLITLPMVFSDPCLTPIVPGHTSLWTSSCLHLRPPNS